MRAASAALTLLCLAGGLPLAAQAASERTSARVPQAELAAVTERGRRLAAYDVAAWHATDAVRALGPSPGEITGYVARELAPGEWEVAFGRLSEAADTFYVAALARQGAGPTQFEARRLTPAAPDTGYYARAARANAQAVRAFGAADRPYNVAALPADGGDWWVYVVPAPTRPGGWPLGGDARFRVRGDGSAIIERRQLHDSVLEMDPPPPGGEPITHTFHTHLRSERPEDTDVFWVLRRGLAVPDYVFTATFIFRVNVDGSITPFDRYVQPGRP
ncbi:MAG TPA: hypothetical protein VKA84_14655 [Gemmatimonadaceae bacterium]|nr:hypothetical protein [Gemmatimonadaceae bacterium]